MTTPRDPGKNRASINRRNLLRAAAGTTAVASLPASGATQKAHHSGTWNELSLTEQLRVVRKATQPYQKLDNMAEAGYVSSPIPLFCSEGYHFDNLANWETPELDPRNPESLFYVLNEAGRLKLGGAEFIVVTELDENGDPVDPRPDLFNDEGESVDDDPLRGISEEDGWNLIVDPGSGLVLWDLHVWVHEYNPDGVFSLPNHRYADMPGCVVLEL